MKHMLNILIITVLALVVIAAGVQLCRPKDHGEYEPWPTKVVSFEETKDGLCVTVEIDDLMGAYLYNLCSKQNFKHSVGMDINHKPKL